MVDFLLIATMILLPPVQQERPTATREPAVLTGCLSQSPGLTGDYTFTNTDGNKFRLTGKDIRKYAGQKVEVVENRSRGFRIRGGLYPSPNVAAQAGAIDPVEAAIAKQPGAGTGTGTTLPELRASRIRVIPGACQ